ncbi:MAG: ATP-grasp domain-containing protein [Burkholderiaceae bacterium]|jgi:acetyl/propionyl-CoA carboxylase alpha subunit|nr:ATP-grasp domain-containing protein [Burkholderiaceae bacterium]
MFTKVLVANRGEIAVRVLRALHDLGVASVAVFAQDDAGALHTRLADMALPLGVTGPVAYLDGAALIGIARAQGCDAVHPGYGFLSESAGFAQACLDAGLAFIGPSPAQLAQLGDKARARALAADCGVPLMPGLNRAVSAEEAEHFFAEQAGQGNDAIVIKAIAGGGGRGMRVVERADQVVQAWQRCTSEAQAAFGTGDVYVECFMAHARHIEIQVLGDGQAVVALGERECSLQRRFQKLVELAPSPSLPADLRTQITDAALRMARQINYCGLGTFEFLVNTASATLPFVFIEANPRLQVEHTVTEAVTGLDLVALQIGVAAGCTLAELGLSSGQPVATRGHAIQWRINAETLDAQGNARPSSGVLSRFDLPSGPGVRVDTHGRSGDAPSPHYDTLLAKLIVHTPTSDFADALRRSQRALAECRVEGLATNLGLLRAIAARPEFAAQQVDNRFIEHHLPELLEQATQIDNASKSAIEGANQSKAKNQQQLPVQDESDGTLTARAPMASKLVQFEVEVGDVVPAGAQLGVLEAMKMEHLLHAPAAGRVVALLAAPGDFLVEGQALLRLEPVDTAHAGQAAAQALDLDAIRLDLQRVIDGHAFTLDPNRVAAVAKRHAQGGRTVRENIADLCELPANDGDTATPARHGSFIEYGALAVAAQTRRRSLQDLMAHTPADGLVAGIGGVNEALFGPERARAIIMGYDYTVLAGTQGWRNHYKKDRMLALAHQLRLPVVLFAEGGGGRPGDVDMPVVAGLNNHTFSQFAALSGLVPVVGVVHGRCFAGNAALLGCCDAIIATRASNIGMGGPAMIEGGGLGNFAPEQIGPANVQSANGVIDVLVQDEAEAVRAARQYLSYFQGTLTDWQCADQRLLRHAVPENRLRVYDMRHAATTLVDNGSWLELRAGFGVGMITALARIEGRPIALLANNPHHLGGAIDADAADKAARFMQLADAHGLPIVALVDTPGFMVGPDIEAQAQVRHVSRMFMMGAHLTVPFFAVVLRKGYGLGAQAMTAGGFDAPVFNVAWPTGEFGAMGLEGAVRLGFRKELEAAPAGPERDALFTKLVAQQYANGEAMNMARTLEIDAVIDPADTRAWLARGLAGCTRMARPAPPRFVDAW